MALVMDSGSTALLVWTTLITSVAALWFFFVRRSRVRELVNKIPGPPGLPVLGNVLDLYVDHVEIPKLILRFCDEYPGLLRGWLLSYAYVLVYEAKYMEPILNSPRHLEKSRDYRFLEPWLGTGLLTSTGDKWRSRRKLLTPAFHFRILEDFVHVFNEQSSILVESLTKEIGKESFDIFPYITLCALDIICDTAMGRNVNAQGHKDSKYVKAVYSIGDIIHSRQFRPWLWPDWFFALTPLGRRHKNCLKVLHGFTDMVIQERKEHFKKYGIPNMEAPSDVIGKKTRLAFLDLLLNASDNGRILSDEDIREEVDTFMFEGHDTTAAGISWALYLLGSNPEAQAKVHEELDQIFDDSDRPCTSDDLKEMRYLECVIKEALRLFPSVPMIARDLKEDVVVDEFIIPAGATAILLPYMLHRNPAVFPDPEAFIPERFLPENSQGRHPFAYVPFSAGPRNCIGQKFALMEEKVVLSTILRKFQIESLTQREDLQILGELILRPQGGIPVRIQYRQLDK